MTIVAKTGGKIAKRRLSFKLPHRILTRVAILGVIGFMVSTYYGPPRYWWSYVGHKEAEVVATLGPAYYDSRKSPPTYNSPFSPDYVPGTPFRLGWYHGVGGILGIDFDGAGFAVAQDRSSK